MKRIPRTDKNLQDTHPGAAPDLSRRNILKWGGFLLAALCLPAVSLLKPTPGFNAEPPQEEPDDTVMYNTSWRIPH